MKNSNSAGVAKILFLFAERDEKISYNEKFKCGAMVTCAWPLNLGWKWIQKIQ